MTRLKSLSMLFAAADGFPDRGGFHFTADIGAEGAGAARKSASIDYSAYIDLFEGNNYTGKWTRVYKNIDLNCLVATPAYDINDQISSARTSPGATVNLCAAHSWGGGCQAISGGRPYLSQSGFDNVTSSLVWGEVPGFPNGGNTACANTTSPCVEFWDAVNYSGSRLSLARPLEFNDLRYTPGGNWNDAISSVKLFNGATVRIYDAHSWGMGYVDVTTSIPDLRDYGFNDRTTSISFMGSIDPASFNPRGIP